MEVRALADLAEIASPLTFRGDALPSEDGNVRLLSIKDLVGINPLTGGALPLVRVQKPAIRSVVFEGDILMPARGYSYPAKIVTNVNETILPTGQIHIIRADKRTVVPSYLVWFLNRKTIQDQIASMLTGATIQSLKKSDLVRLEVELPPIDVQRKIGELNELKLRREIARRKLQELEAKEIDELCILAAKGHRT